MSVRRKSPSQHGRSWGPKKNSQLLNFRKRGIKYEVISKVTGRTPEALYQQHYMLRKYGGDGVGTTTKEASTRSKPAAKSRRKSSRRKTR
jgi:hypothetical protein